MNDEYQFRGERTCCACGQHFALKPFVTWYVNSKEHWRCDDCLPPMPDYEMINGWRVPLNHSDMSLIWKRWHNGDITDDDKKAELLDYIMKTWDYGKPRSKGYAAMLLQKIYCYENGLPFEKSLKLSRDMAPSRKDLSKLDVGIKLNRNDKS